MNRTKKNKKKQKTTAEHEGHKTVCKEQESVGIMEFSK